MTTYFTFTLLSHSDTPPTVSLANGWEVNFYPLTADSFAALNVHLDQSMSFFNTDNGRDGTTGDFYTLVGQFNNFGGFPTSYVVDFDRNVGPYNDPSSGWTHYGTPRGSSLVLGNTAGFLQGTYPSSFFMSAQEMSAPYTVGIGSGTQAYSKSDPQFSIPYGVYNCPGTWSIRDGTYRSVCSVQDTYAYSFDNTGTLALAGTQTQTLASYTNVGYCAMMDGTGDVSVFTDTNGTLVLSEQSFASDTLALAFVTAQYGQALPSGAHGFLRVNVSQTYTDRLVLTSANDGKFDWSSLPQEVQDRVSFAGLIASGVMSTQAVYTITSTQA